MRFFFVRLLGVVLVCHVAILHAQQTAALRSGPMVGYGEMTEVMLWVQTTGPAEVHYRYWIEGEKGSVKSSPRIIAMPEREFIVHTLIAGLQEGKKYEYEILLDGKVVRCPYPLRFQTQPLWQWRKDPPNFTVAVGSCNYVNDPPTDRPGKPYGSDHEIFTAIASMKPDLMLWIGDNTYYREIDWFSESAMKYRNAHTRALAEMQPLLGATHNYATWDDHDYGPNDSDRSYSMRTQSLEIFKLFWANRTYGTEETPGVFGRFEWGDIEFFLLDDRYHRSPNRMPDDFSKTMFGKRQLQWLQEALVSSDAPFKIIINGNQMLNLVANKESFGRYTAEYKELIGWLKAQRIPGVLFLSGDRHFAELLRFDEPGLYPLYDFTSSPLSAGLSVPEKENPSRVAGTLVSDAKNFGMLRFDGPRNDRRLTMECYDKDGKLRWSHTVRASDLKHR